MNNITYFIKIFNNRPDFLKSKMKTKCPLVPESLEHVQQVLSNQNSKEALGLLNENLG